MKRDNIMKAGAFNSKLLSVLDFKKNYKFRATSS